MFCGVVRLNFPPLPLPICFYCVFGRFSIRGTQKRDKKNHEGRRRKIKLKATYTWQMINGVGRCLFFFFFFCGVFVRFSTRGVKKHHKKNWGKNMSKTFGRKNRGFFFRLFPAFLCVSQQGEFKNTTKNVLGKIHVKSFWPKKLRKKPFFLSSLSHRFFLSRFLAVSLHEEPKNTIQMFSKIGPENLKKSQKR
jgi:hypothetical protein